MPVSYTHLDVYKRQVEDSLFFVSSSLKVIEVGPDGRLIRSLRKTKEDGIKRTMTFDIDGERSLELAYREKPPTFLVDGKPLTEGKKTLWNRSYLLGTDSLGRDLLTRDVYKRQRTPTDTKATSI